MARPDLRRDRREGPRDRSAAAPSRRRPQPAGAAAGLILARPQGEWDDLGGTKVSTGQVGRYDYFLNPIEVLLHTDAILDWRAKTFNAHHVRGLGENGLRI